MIWTTDREPTIAECRKDNGQFLVQTIDGERFSCGYRPFTEKEGMKQDYDNPKWECNVPVVGWMALPPKIL